MGEEEGKGELEGLRELEGGREEEREGGRGRYEILDELFMPPINDKLNYKTLCHDCLPN